MSAPFRIRSATEDDNGALLELVRLCPMRGPVELGAERGPRFLALNERQGDPWFVVVVEDRAGEVVACAASAVRDVYVDGERTRVSYVGDLRVAPRARHSTILPRIHRFGLERLAECGVDLAYTTIVEGNRQAEALRGRRLLPRYVPVGRIRVAAVTGAPRPNGGEATVEPARPHEIPEIARLLDASARRRDFAPAWTAERLERTLAVTPGLSPGRFLVMRVRGELVGALAAWDQGALQRRRVLAYHGGAAIYRRLHDLRALVRGRARLPRSGELLRELHVTHVAVEDDDPRRFATLLREAWHRFSGGYHFMTFGLAEGHPLLSALEGFEYGSFHTMLYAIPAPGSAWERHEFRRIPFHEISHL